MSIAFRFCVVTVLTAVLAACSTGPRAPSGDVVQLQFGAGEGAKADPRVLKVFTHCCCGGDIATAQVSTIPPPGGKGPLLSELVLELTPKGEIQHRWPMPVDSVVIGVRGDQILVSLDADRSIFISPVGKIAVTSTPSPLPERREYTCPELQDFKGSAYLQCFEFRDLVNGDTRRIAFEAPCT